MHYLVPVLIPLSTHLSYLSARLKNWLMKKKTKKMTMKTKKMNIEKLGFWSILHYVIAVAYFN